MSESDSTPRVDLDAKLENEIQAALGDESLEKILEAETKSVPAAAPSEAAKAPARRDDDERPVRAGTVQAIHADLVLVEFDPKTQGACPLDQFDEQPKVGDSLEFMLDRFNDNEGLWVLNRRGAVTKAQWESLEKGQIVEARVTGMVKGGLECECANHKAFMPASQVDINFIKDISIFLSEKIRAEVIELDKRRKRIVLSRKKVMAAEREQMRKELVGTLSIGKRVKAKITTIQPYGAFADIGGMDGLIHISDMSYERLKHPSEVVKEGDEVEVEITKIDETREPPRLSLSMKKLMTDPYEEKLSALTEGDEVSGKVTKITDFGAFVEVAPGIEGLVHISELAHERVRSVGHVVKVDEVVNVKILSIDSSTRRIGLSIKALTDAPPGTEANPDRKDDPELRKLKAMLSNKFGDSLKGGIGRGDGGHWN